MRLEFQRYTDIEAFQKDVLDALMTKEAQNNLIIGIIERGVRLDCAGEWLMGRVLNDTKTELVALMTPPHNLLISEGDIKASDEAIEKTVCYLKENDISIPGLLCEKDLAHRFTEIYTNSCGGAFSVEMQERAYELREINDLEPIGKIRLADEKDMHFLPYWLAGFMEDALGCPFSISEDAAKAHIENKSLYVLEVEGMPVSIAGTARKTPNGRSIGPVYTPPYLRKKGYAANCVMQLSRKLMDEGNKFLALFTDLSNPSSNAAYIKVDYKPVCDFTQLKYGK